MKKLLLLFIIILLSFACKPAAKDLSPEVVMTTFHLWVHPQHEYFSYAGDVKNIGWSTAHNVIVKLTVLFQDDDPYAVKIQLVDPPDLGPGIAGKWRIEFLEANEYDIAAIDFEETEYEILWDEK